MKVKLTLGSVIDDISLADFISNSKVRTRLLDEDGLINNIIEINRKDEELKDILLYTIYSISEGKYFSDNNSLIALLACSQLVIDYAITKSDKYLNVIEKIKEDPDLSNYEFIKSEFNKIF